MIYLLSDSLGKKTGPHGERDFREKIFDSGEVRTHNIKNRSSLLYQPSYKFRLELFVGNFIWNICTALQLTAFKPLYIM